MVYCLDLADDDQDLQEFIDKKANNLFGPRVDRPQLQVSRIFKNSGVSAANTISLELDVDVQNTFQLHDLETVRFSTLCLSRKCV